MSNRDCKNSAIHCLSRKATYFSLSSVSHSFILSSLRGLTPPGSPVLLSLPYPQSTPFMSLREQLADALAHVTPGGYGSRGVHYSEPSAWAALAMLVAARHDVAMRACYWLSRIQQNHGAVGISSAEQQPCWPTALAMLAWHRWHVATGENRFADCIERAMAWTLDQQGSTSPRKPQIGHDTTLAGWSWAAATHSWLEPTAFFYRAGRELGMGSHPRFVESRRLIFDRALPSGGWNYGNTIVLGQELLPHVQPTGIALWSLAASGERHDKVETSLRYLSEAIDARTTTASLSFAIMGLAPYNHVGPLHRLLLEKLSQRALNRSTSTYHLALLTLANYALANE